MSTALDWIGAFFLADLLSVAVLAALVQVASRGGPNPARRSASLGIFIFAGIGLALIYGGLWMLFRLSK